MQGFSVVVNVITRSESSRQSVFTGNAALFEGGNDVYGGSWQFTAKDGDRTWGFTLSDGMSTSDSNGVGPVVRRDGAGTILRQEDFFNDQSGGGNSLRVNYASPFLGGKIDLTARYGINDFSNINLQTSPTVRRESVYAEDGASGEFGLVYTRDIDSRLKSETRFIHEFSDNDSSAFSRVTENAVNAPEQRFSSVSESSETILRSLLRYEHSPKLTIETGGEVAYNMLETEQAFSVGGVAVPLPSASVKVEETRGELFAKGTWRLRDNLTLESGVRVEASTISQSGDADKEKSFYFIKPRFLATWTPRPNNQFRLRFEREVGQLNFSDFAASAELEDENVFGGNIDLEPEQRWISELAYERRFWGDGIVSITLRHDEISDAIDVIPLDGGLSANGNIGDGTLDQLAVNILVPMDKVGFTGGRVGFRNTWNKTEVTDPTTGETRPISDVRPTQATITIAQDIKSWNLQWGGAWLPLLGLASYDPDQRIQLARQGLFRALGRIQADPDPVVAGSDQRLERLRPGTHRLRRPPDPADRLHRNPSDRPADLLPAAPAQDVLIGSGGGGGFPLTAAGSHTCPAFNWSRRGFAGNLYRQGRRHAQGILASERRSVRPHNPGPGADRAACPRNHRPAGRAGVRPRLLRRQPPGHGVRHDHAPAGLRLQLRRQRHARPGRRVGQRPDRRPAALGQDR